MSHFNHFDYLAHLYDRLIKPSDPEKMVSLAALPVPGFLLDVGGGTGRSSEWLKNLASGIVIADPSMGMLAQANQKSLLCVCANSEELPFASESFDCVIMVDAFHHVRDYRETSKELFRMVKNGGRIIIEEPNINILAVKFMAIFEKLVLMRSHFVSPQKIQAGFAFVNVNSHIALDGTTAWVVVEKING